jgi:hypothetical protein
MPQNTPARRAPRPGHVFRKRYDDLERRRAELLARLSRLDDKARQSPSYRSALTLLNTTFRKSKLLQRVAILQSAQWLIDVVEKWTMMN